MLPQLIIPVHTDDPSGGKIHSQDLASKPTGVWIRLLWPACSSNSRDTGRCWGSERNTKHRRCACDWRSKVKKPGRMLIGSGLLCFEKHVVMCTHSISISRQRMIMMNLVHDLSLVDTHAHAKSLGHATNPCPFPIQPSFHQR